ncbi:hypothetical protein U14_03860 [Candidatus Moduliflexus flocculans]|uniref:Uncharacterized protein n=1 Tax=Candidatus Moduliflexus flocculans TaxID=1499966 RepID=A0A081BQE2_9BACT|nr:hypothetical protein U14_03860 [Candidatus Moduliflexus flocculans]
MPFFDKTANIVAAAVFQAEINNRGIVFAGFDFSDRLRLRRDAGNFHIVARIEQVANRLALRFVVFDNQQAFRVFLRHRHQIIHRVLNINFVDRLLIIADRADRAIGIVAFFA